MKNKLRIILIIILCICSIFIIEECIRLRMYENSIPLVCFYVDEKTSDDIKKQTLTFYSLGFKTRIDYVLDDGSSLDNRMYGVVGKKFHLFNIIRLWSWTV